MKHRFKYSTDITKYNNNQSGTYYIPYEDWKDFRTMYAYLRFVIPFGNVHILPMVNLKWCKLNNIPTKDIRALRDSVWFSPHFFDSNGEVQK